MIDKAKGLPADEVFLDLEDAVAPDAKAEARTRVAAALAEPGWAGQLRGVRVNDWTTPWTHADIIEVVSAVAAAPHAELDVVVLPKVSDVSHVQALDLLLTQLETIHGLPIGEIGIDAQIEDARGLMNVDAIAAVPRTRFAIVVSPPGGRGKGCSLNPSSRRKLLLGAKVAASERCRDGPGALALAFVGRDATVLAERHADVVEPLD